MKDQIIVHLAEGFEEIEAVTIIDVLRRAGLDVVVVSITGNLMVKGSHQIEIKADLLFEKYDYTNGKMIILPGGMPGSKILNEHKGLKNQIVEYKKNDKYLAAICAAPMVLGDIGILKGKRAVCYPGYEAHLIGAEVLSDPYVVDGKIITGRGVGAALKFSLELVRILVGEECSVQLSKAMLIK
jgi:4-methyl-5(b-hydroxyethyl)-thiazole monophosphate biosynthesis